MLWCAKEGDYLFHHSVRRDFDAPCPHLLTWCCSFFDERVEITAQSKVIPCFLFENKMTTSWLDSWWILQHIGALVGGLLSELPRRELRIFSTAKFLYGCRTCLMLLLCPLKHHNVVTRYHNVITRYS